MTTGSASSVATSTATIGGTVNPQGEATTYHFDYGTSTSYGSTAPASPPYPSAGSGSSAAPESANLTGLSPNTTYHYRIEATNAFGASYGTDGMFTTNSAAQAPTVTTGICEQRHLERRDGCRDGEPKRPVDDVPLRLRDHPELRLDVTRIATVSECRLRDHSPVGVNDSHRPRSRHHLPLPHRGNQRLRHQLWVGSDVHDYRQRSERWQLGGDVWGSGYVLGGWNGGVMCRRCRASASIAQGSRYLWAANTSDVRALQSADQSLAGGGYVL